MFRTIIIDYTKINHCNIYLSPVKGWDYWVGGERIDDVTVNMLICVKLSLLNIFAIWNVKRCILEYYKV